MYRWYLRAARMSLISISNDAIICADISTFPLRIAMIIFAMVLFRTSITYPTEDSTSFSDPTAAVFISTNGHPTHPKFSFIPRPNFGLRDQQVDLRLLIFVVRNLLADHEYNR